ncbi:MAG: DNA mismatch repair endonuclease MutL [Clostridiales bacterium]|nr:DNA mismatch repair endonuclease MutL [Clostridiales bacterium]
MLDYRIIQLDKDISNKIAAGEVVERPLAVVKELVENAIDAQSTKITVEVKDAGKTLIRITDNGLGIQPSDLLLAFERHSTSKIRTINDIYNISSLGFRGEALASIASVSNVEMISKHNEYDLGKRIMLSGGVVKENIDVGAPQGTTIMVKELFFNTPARLKFLKSNNAEQNAVNDIMSKLAMSHPEISFKYIVNGQNIFITPGNKKLYDVILNVYQKSLAKNLLPIDYFDNGITLTGYTSSIEMTRGNRQNQIVFVNNRYVKSKTVDNAIATVYRTIIPHNRFPIVFLNIQIDPSLIDINIHPAKTEIRFHQEGVIKDLIYKALKFELNKFNLVPDKPLNSTPVNNKEVLKSYAEVNRLKSKDTISERSVVDVKANFTDITIEQETHNNAEIFKRNLSSTQKNDYKTCQEKKEKTKVLLNNYKTLTKDKPIVSKPLVREDSHIMIEKTLMKDEKPFNNKLIRETPFVEDVYKPLKPMFESEEETIYDHLMFIGQIFNTYLIYEKKGEMYLIDQHAAHEKILFENFVMDYKQKKIVSQMILVPITVDVSTMTKLNVLNNKESLQNLGFDIEEFGENSLVVREIPQAFDLKTATFLINDLIDKMDFTLPEERFELALDTLMQRSCKAAIKANDSLMDIEVKSLISQLKGLDDPYTCPHGRPIIIKISKGEIEKKFNRT